jgi:hypothetical protein
MSHSDIEGYQVCVCGIRVHQDPLTVAAHECGKDLQVRASSSSSTQNRCMCCEDVISGTGFNFMVCHSCYHKTRSERYDIIQQRRSCNAAKTAAALRRLASAYEQRGDKDKGGVDICDMYASDIMEGLLNLSAWVE